jgi:hypothetical protein
LQDQLVQAARLLNVKAEQLLAEGAGVDLGGFLTALYGLLVNLPLPRLQTKEHWEARALTACWLGGWVAEALRELGTAAKADQQVPLKELSCRISELGPPRAADARSELLAWKQGISEIAPGLLIIPGAVAVRRTPA